MKSIKVIKTNKQNNFKKILKDYFFPILFEILMAILVFVSVLYIDYCVRMKEGCWSSNPELLENITEYGDKIGVCVCDASNCLYVCEKMKKEYHFKDDCKSVCIPSDCSGISPLNEFTYYITKMFRR